MLEDIPIEIPEYNQSLQQLRKGISGWETMKDNTLPVAFVPLTWPT